MPQIPRYRHTEEYPTPSRIPSEPSIAPFRSIAELGEAMLEVAERDRRAEIQKQALEVGNAIRDDQDQFAEDLYNRNDYRNFVNDVDGWEKKAREKYQPMSRISDGSDSPKLAQAIDVVISSRSAELKRLARDKARQVMVGEAKGEWEKSKLRYAQDYVAEEDPDKRTIIKNNMEIEARKLATEGILWPKEAEIDIQQFDAVVTKVRQENAKARAKEMIFTDAEAALELLMDKDVLPDLDPTDRVTLMEHAEVRIRVEGTRLDKLTKAIQNENRARVLDEYAGGALDLERLKEYRAIDAETGQRGLSDEFFTTMLEKLRQGRDTVSDSDTFNRLYLKDDLKWSDVDKESEKLSEKDTRTLLSRILQERREDVRDARRYRKEAEAEARREEAAEEKITRERRNAYIAVAKKFLVKAMNEAGVDADEGVEILRTFQGYIDDKKIASEDLPMVAEKLMESHKGGVIRWIKGLLGIEKKEEMPPPEGIPKRKSLDEIFGGRKP